MSVKKTNNREWGWHKYVIANTFLIAWAIIILMKAASTIQLSDTLEPLDKMENEVAFAVSWFVIIFDILSLFVMANSNLKENRFSFMNIFSLLFFPISILVLSVGAFWISFLVGLALIHMWARKIMED